MYIYVYSVYLCVSYPYPPTHPPTHPLRQTLLEQHKQKLSSWAASEAAIATAVADPNGSVTPRSPSPSSWP